MLVSTIKLSAPPNGYYIWIAEIKRSNKTGEQKLFKGGQGRMINLEAAIEILRGRNLQCGSANVLKQPLQLAISALEKQVPKEVNQKSRSENLRRGDCCPVTHKFCEEMQNIPQPEISEIEYFTNHCPACGSTCELGGQEYCGHCGQALKFPEVSGL